MIEGDPFANRMLRLRQYSGGLKYEGVCVFSEIDVSTGLQRQVGYGVNEIKDPVQLFLQCDGFQGYLQYRTYDTLGMITLLNPLFGPDALGNVPDSPGSENSPLCFKGAETDVSRELGTIFTKA
jgi:hypothetical protein